MSPTLPNTFLPLLPEGIENISPSLLVVYQKQEKCKGLNRAKVAASLGSSPEVDSGNWEFRKGKLKVFCKN